MAKILSAKEAKLQKKLIPLNIFVVVLSLVAALSLFFAPILKVDIGKILSSPKLEQVIDDTLNQTVGGSIQGSGQEGIDYSPVITNVVKGVFSDVKGSISITAYDASQIALSSEEGKATEVFNNLLFGDKGLVTELIDSLIKGIIGIFEKPEGKQLIEKTVVTTIASTVVADLPEDIAGKVTEEKVEELTETFVKLNDAKSEEDVKAVVDELVTELNGIIEEDLDPEVVDEVKTLIVDMYNDTIESLPEDQEFSLEAMICVAVSSNIDLGEFNLAEILNGLVGSGENSPENTPENTPEASNVRHVVEGEVPPESGSQEGSGTVCTTYSQLLQQMGLDEDNEELVKSITTAVETTVNDALKDVSEYFTYYGYLFYGMLVFIVPWLILALFALIHTFTKNKRFMMWYVKLYSFIPGLIWVALTAMKMIIAKEMVPAITEMIPDFEKTKPVIEAVLDGVSSYTWISGLCFVLLWLVSIFWAFPIKHKIRKERKACKNAKKNGTYSYDDYGGDLGYGVTNEENYGYGSTGDYGSGDTYGDSYGDSYDSDLYGSSGYSDDGLDDGGYDYGFNDDIE